MRGFGGCEFFIRFLLLPQVFTEVFLQLERISGHDNFPKTPKEGGWLFVRKESSKRKQEEKRANQT